MEKYKHHEPWFGIEQEYTMMRPSKVVGEKSTMPLGFNADGTEPAAKHWSLPCTLGDAAPHQCNPSCYPAKPHYHSDIDRVARRHDAEHE